ncbi:MAG: TonB-dependent receptor [Flavobacterium sp.]|nr:MAG: TonB-dependent receptor [Flavobacterium sp.]
MQNYNKIRSCFLQLFLCLILAQFAGAQQRFTISGTITDQKSNEILIGVNIRAENAGSGTVTNEYGFYSLTLPAGKYTLLITSIGYSGITADIDLVSDVKRNFALSADGELLEEVTVTEKQRSNIRRAEMSTNKLTVESIKKMPVVLGEVDVLKSILLLPGVTNAGEGASGFNVRGGAADQNLILLDEATIFNSSHVFGFFSVFNPDAIKDLKLYKGGIPARFGGRVSSVLDIYQKDGNSNDFEMSGGIGLITSRLLAEGPIVKGKGSFLAGGRASYGHLLLKGSKIKNSAYFYDLNTKLNYKLNASNSLFLSGYFGRDVFDLSGSFKNTYGNATLNLRWNHLFTDKLFSNLSLIYSDYYYGLDLDFVGFRYDSGIKNYNLRYDFRNYISEKLGLQFGVNAIYYEFNPGTIYPLGADSGFNFAQLDRKYAFEPSAYAEAEYKVTEKMSVRYGLRCSAFYRLGPSTVNIYEDTPVRFDDQMQVYQKAEPIGTDYYNSNEVLKSYGNIEPRVAISYSLSNDRSIKISYNRMAQYLQLVSNTSSPTPLDVWTPSDRYIRPQLLDQYAIGYFANFKDDLYSFEAETFYKNVHNRIDYIDGADLIANDALEQVVLNGKMRAYGLELMFRKNTGRLNGWLSYTLSRSEQKTPGRNISEPGINNGNWYRSAYDKTHNLAVTASFQYSKKWAFGSNFTLQTGQPATFPTGQYQYQDFTVPSYGPRNHNNLPAYHHLDLSATYTPKPDKKKGWRSEWVFSLYNVYNRHNAASISFTQNQETAANEAIRFSIFGIVPGVSYNFKF